MKIHDMEQGTLEWMTIRIGIPTASRFDSLLTPKTRKPSGGRPRHRAELLAEWLLGQPLEWGTSAWMDRGTEMEGEARKLPSPFMVIATQNMAETHGAFPLPESQLDRFMISMGMGMPTAQAEAEILTRSQHGIPDAKEVLTGERVVEMQDVVAGIEVSVPIRQYMVNVVRATRSADGVQFGVSPRGGAALQRASQCWAAFSGRTFVEPGDVKAVAPYVLPHRIMLGAGAVLQPAQIVASILDSVAVPA